MNNQKELAPFAHYAKLFANADPEEITERTGVLYENGTFFIKMLGSEYVVSHPDYRPENVTAVHTFLLRFLLEGHKGEAEEKFLTFREMPWGEVYLQPFSGRIIKRAAFTFGTNLELLHRAAKRLHAIPLQHGDAAYEFEFFENYRLRLIVWQGDEEFAPNAQILYSSNFVHFTAEDRVVIAELFINELKR